MTVLPVNVDDDLIESVDAQAAESGRSRSDVLAAAPRRGLGGGPLGVQGVLALGTVPLQGERFRRRPAAMIEALPLKAERRERFGPFGIVERLAAVKAPAD